MLVLITISSDRLASLLGLVVHHHLLLLVDADLQLERMFDEVRR